ncbi:hypothetical protein TNCT6_68730 [Streptomyces sp. 6-11-2]|nr:hypothetical protein TNCT6_68730 [Streptomyces sp. 6-11-2]
MTAPSTSSCRTDEALVAAQDRGESEESQVVAGITFVAGAESAATPKQGGKARQARPQTSTYLTAPAE